MHKLSVNWRGVINWRLIPTALFMRPGLMDTEAMDEIYITAIIQEAIGRLQREFITVLIILLGIRWISIRIMIYM